MMITLDMYQTMAVAVVALLLGKFLRNKIYIFNKILYSCTGNWWTHICNFNMHMLCNAGIAEFDI